MKTNDIYITGKNVDLENENFLIKKGTLLEVTNLFNETDPSIPTKVEFKIDKINGSYTLKEVEFKNLINSNAFKQIGTSKFKIGDCVIQISSNKQGTVISKQYYNSISSWLYGVNFDGEKIGVMENELRSCA